MTLSIKSLEKLADAGSDPYFEQPQPSVTANAKNTPKI